MPRRLKIATKELGPLELYVIYETDGVWEGTWQPVQGSDVTSLMTTISKEVYDHALKGWTRPLITALGLAPSGALRKLPLGAARCAARTKCPFFDKKACVPASPKMPVCFEADVSPDEQKRHLTSEIIKLWRDGVYVVVVQE